jgi:hypothetical protein
VPGTLPELRCERLVENAIVRTRLSMRNLALNAAVAVTLGLGAMATYAALGTDLWFGHRAARAVNVQAVEHAPLTGTATGLRPVVHCGDVRGATAGEGRALKVSQRDVAGMAYISFAQPTGTRCPAQPRLAGRPAA